MEAIGWSIVSALMGATATREVSGGGGSVGGRNGRLSRVRRGTERVERRGRAGWRGMEEEEEKVIPDYYEPQSLVPDIPPRLQWVEDSEGQVINHHEEFLQSLPPGYFQQPKSHLTQRFDSNLRQMQETRKVCSKIGVIKQMQIQTQVCFS